MLAGQEAGGQSRGSSRVLGHQPDDFHARVSVDHETVRVGDSAKSTAPEEGRRRGRPPLALLAFVVVVRELGLHAVHRVSLETQLEPLDLLLERWEAVLRIE